MRSRRSERFAARGERTRFGRAGARPVRSDTQARYRGAAARQDRDGEPEGVACACDVLLAGVCRLPRLRSAAMSAAHRRSRSAEGRWFQSQRLATVRTTSSCDPAPLARRKSASLNRLRALAASPSNTFPNISQPILHFGNDASLSTPCARPLKALPRVVRFIAESGAAVLRRLLLHRCWL